MLTARTIFRPALWLSCRNASPTNSFMHSYHFFTFSPLIHTHTQFPFLLCSTQPIPLRCQKGRLIKWEELKWRATIDVTKKSNEAFGSRVCRQRSAGMDRVEVCFGPGWETAVSWEVRKKTIGENWERGRICSLMESEGNGINSAELAQLELEEELGSFLIQLWSSFDMFSVLEASVKYFLHGQEGFIWAMAATRRLYFVQELGFSIEKASCRACLVWPYWCLFVTFYHIVSCPSGNFLTSTFVLVTKCKSHVFDTSGSLVIADDINLVVVNDRKHTMWTSCMKAGLDLHTNVNHLFT